MVSSFISRIVILIFGTLYPAYASYKAVRTKNVKEYVKWMMYWIVFALFTCAETFTDLFLSFWFPFYYEIKIITVIYLLSPATRGSSILYRKFVHPVLTKREQEIDEYIAKAKEQGYHTILNLGSKGVSYATCLLMQTAIKGGGGLVSQLKRSYSLSDLSDEQQLRNQKREIEDEVDSRYEEESRVVRNAQVYSPRRTIPGTNSRDLYFPEVDTFQHPLDPDDERYYSHIPSSEEISSGYSSGDPLHAGARRSKGDHLVRTASLGGSSRVRTRAAVRTGLPKRSSLSEGGSTWSSVESTESQLESDDCYNLLLSQSPHFPFSVPALNHLAGTEYEQVLGNIAQQQMFAFMHPAAFLNRVPESTFKTYEKNVSTINPSVVISEVKCDADDVEKSEVPSKEIGNGKVDTASGGSTEAKEIVTESNKKNTVVTLPEDKKSERSSKTPEVMKELAVDRENSPKERSGKYHKKPAPIPPNDEADSKRGSTLTLEDEDEVQEFGTPSGSPQLERKLKNSSEPPKETVEEDKNETNVEEQKMADTKEEPSKHKAKAKKDFHISKKLHLPKMPFSFWNQKGGKHSSGSETSSIGSAEISVGKPDDKSETEIYIPLKDEATDDKSDEKESSEID